MASFKPELSKGQGAPTAGNPVPKLGGSPIPAAKKWTFGFEYWLQREYFGVKECDGGWFVSLLERLRDFSRMSIEEVTKNPAIANSKAMRYHPIGWDRKNVPLKRSELDHIPPDGDGNDFEICQFSISKALGRIVGFFDDSHVFQIVLLDPKHNIQPSKDFGYKVDETKIADCHFASFTQHVMNEVQLEPNEAIKARLVEVLTITTYKHTGGCVISPINEDQLIEYQHALTTGVINDANDLFEYALSSLYRANSSETE